MNPLENEIREVLTRREPPAGFTERVMSQAAGSAGSRTLSRSTPYRLIAPAAVILIAIVLAGAAGLFITRCASACSIGSSREVAGNAGVIGVNSFPSGAGHSRGPENAEIVLEEFGDYQCPACGTYFPIIEDILQKYPNQVRLEYHHFPLTKIHANAMSAAVAAEAAGEQDHFWQMHALLYQHHGEWAKVSNPETQFETFAQQLGLDLNQFRQSCQSARNSQLVQDDMTRGQEANITATPAFFINGKAISTPATVEEFSLLIESHLPQK